MTAAEAARPILRATVLRRSTSVRSSASSSQVANFSWIRARRSLRSSGRCTVRPSEQADEAELAEGSLVVVGLGVGGALFLRHRDLRAEPFEGQRPVMREQADGAGQVAAGLPGRREGDPVALVIGPA